MVNKRKREHSQSPFASRPNKNASRFTMAVSPLLTVRTQLHLFLGLHVASAFVRKDCVEPRVDHRWSGKAQQIWAMRRSWFWNDVGKEHATEMFSVTIGNDFLID